MTSYDLTEYPVTVPVPVVRADVPARVPDRAIAHVASTMQLAPAVVGSLADHNRRWRLDNIGHKLARRAQVQADSSYKIAKSWGSISLDQVDLEDLDGDELDRILDLINLVKKAWSEYHRDQDYANEMRRKHTSRRRRRTAVTTVGSSGVLGFIAWQLKTDLPAAIAGIGGVSLLGSYAFGLAGRGSERRAMRHTRSELVPMAPRLENPVADPFPLPSHEDPLQLLRDIMTTRREGETGVWTSVLVRRLREECGTRYSTLVAKDLRQMLETFITDPAGTRLEEGKARMTVDAFLLEHLKDYHPTIEAKLGKSKPLAGYHYKKQIQAAIAVAEGTYIESEYAL